MMPSDLRTTDEGELVGTLPCGHDAQMLVAGWHYRILCAGCYQAWLRKRSACDAQDTDQPQV